VRDPEAPLGATVPAPPPPDPEPVVRPVRDPEAPLGATVPATTAPPDDGPDDGPPTGTTSTTTTVPPAPDTQVSEESTPDEPATTLEPADLPPAPPDSVRVATWNLGQGAAFTNAGGTDRHEIDSVAEDLHQSGADVVMVQEVFREDAHVLADELQGRAPEGTEVHINFSHAGDKRRFDERNPVESIFDWIAGEEFGNAVITYAPQTELIDERLPSDGDEGRSVVGSSTEVREEELRVFTTHITSQEPREEFGPPTGTTTPGTTTPPTPEIHDPQSAQIGRVLEEADGSGPMILGGDFNVTLGSSRPSAAVINGYDERGFTDAGAGAGDTSSCGEGNRIDYVFTEDVEVLGSYVMSCGPSDHAAVVVDVRVP
jgi:endonuclease/exonuclease/phosphatase family metal-dependent hydrolase